MGWFSRGKKSVADGAADVETPARPVLETDESLIDADGMGPLRPRERGLGERERSRIADGLAALAQDGVEVSDLRSLGAAYDRAYAEWSGTARRNRPDHDVIVDRFAIGIGEHLARTTDLRWRIVTDVFGTDLALADQKDGDFVVVPGNLVASRWMRGETGWIPGVVGHLVGIRGE